MEAVRPFLFRTFDLKLDFKIIIVKIVRQAASIGTTKMNTEHEHLHLMLYDQGIEYLHSLLDRLPSGYRYCVPPLTLGSLTIRESVLCTSTHPWIAYRKVQKFAVQMQGLLKVCMLGRKDAEGTSAMLEKAGRAKREWGFEGQCVMPMILATCYLVHIA